MRVDFAELVRLLLRRIRMPDRTEHEHEFNALRQLHEEVDRLARRVDALERSIGQVAAELRQLYESEEFDARR